VLRKSFIEIMVAREYYHGKFVRCIMVDSFIQTTVDFLVARVNLGQGRN
jgi:hypothetical protein